MISYRFILFYFAPEPILPKRQVLSWYVPGTLLSPSICSFFLGAKPSLATLVNIDLYSLLQVFLHPHHPPDSWNLVHCASEVGDY